MFDKDRVIVWGIRMGIVGLISYFTLSFICLSLNVFEWHVSARIALLALITAGIYLVNKVSNG